MLAISFNFLNTPPAVRLAGWNIVRWLLRELSATRPKSPFSWASALILSNCRPGNESQTLNSSCLNRWLVEMGGISGQSENAQLRLNFGCIKIVMPQCAQHFNTFYQLLEQQLSSALSRQHQAPSPGMQDPVGSNTGTHSTAGHLEYNTHSLATQSTSTVTHTTADHSQTYRSTKRSLKMHKHKPADIWIDTHTEAHTKIIHTHTLIQHTPIHAHKKQANTHIKTDTHTHIVVVSQVFAHSHAHTQMNGLIPSTFMCNLASSSPPW